MICQVYASSAHLLAGFNVVELEVFADPRAGRAVVIGAIDDLIKGARRAVQNMNSMAGVDETTSLPTGAVVP